MKSRYEQNTRVMIGNRSSESATVPKKVLKEKSYLQLPKMSTGTPGRFARRSMSISAPQGIHRLTVEPTRLLLGDCHIVTVCKPDIAVNGVQAYRVRFCIFNVEHVLLREFPQYLQLHQALVKTVLFTTLRSV